ncbi:MAG: 30S ribosomal protein S12 methylthiotransferase RimO [Candidatus Nanopelagicales bacterium]
MTLATGGRRVALLTLGCTRNEVDSEELAASLLAGGWEVSQDARNCDVVLVNTCGFIDAAKAESIQTLLAAAEPDATGQAPQVVAAGCMAQRYGSELAAELPEAAAVLGFDDYPQIAARLDDVLAGRPLTAHKPEDRRQLLPLTPISRQATEVYQPGHGHLRNQAPTWNAVRHRLGDGPIAALKIASGCDRRCAFCAIPSFRGAFVSRPRAELLSEAAWLAAQGARELLLVSENSTSYGKDLGDPLALPALLRDLAEVPGIVRTRVTYLQPAELRAETLAAISSLPRVADYFDLSFQHASSQVLRTMRRFGGTADFLRLIGQVRAMSPDAGLRSNFIVGFPGETAEDFAELREFLERAELDAIGVFGYSDEEGTEGAGLGPKVPADVIAARVDELAELADELMAQRAVGRIGQAAQVLITGREEGAAVGRAGFQGPEDGQVSLPGCDLPVGELVSVRLIGSDGVDLFGEML